MDKEKEPVWRDIWQEIIEASGKDLRNKDKLLSEFQKIEQKYPKDKMILFEKGIALEILGERETAKEYYTKAIDEKEGLSVEHWRKRAKYFYDRISSTYDYTTDINTMYPFESIQWDVYFNIHTYCFLDSYIRYLAVSSVSRLYSEPAMAIVIFRTCLEIGLWTYFPKEAEEINKEWQQENLEKREGQEISLDSLLFHMNKRKLFSNTECDIYYKTKFEGNLAAHPGKIKKDLKPFKYSDDQLKDILDYFNQAMRFLNERAKERG